MDKDKLVQVIVSQRIIKNSFKKFVTARAIPEYSNLSNNEIMTLFYLRAFKGLTQKEMSVYLDYDLATAGRILNSMNKRGLITRVKSKEDARRNDIELTEKGIKVMDALFNFADEWYKQYAQEINDNSKNSKTPVADNVIALAKKLTENWGGTNGWKE